MYIRQKDQPNSFSARARKRERNFISVVLANEQVLYNMSHGQDGYYVLRCRNIGGRRVDGRRSCEEENHPK